VVYMRLAPDPRGKADNKWAIKKTGGTLLSFYSTWSPGEAQSTIESKTNEGDCASWFIA